ncbi:hypothetical protein SLEP1_g41854 [Rubroshorea leprosula]|uniref:Protein kinase domain-containing protein n=1 Tax=Rubroshorea leprosula TaxID=152421 RepID=A0AAV5L7U8_9ROSI|nr:hypothetical protein SLEP1_g41854 [Rubroshorea leprosula]
MASVEKLTALFKLFFLVAVLLQWGGSHAQQPYLNNKQLNCSEQSDNFTKGYYCNGLHKSCASYITFRSTPPYNTAVAIGYLLNANATQIVSLNNFPSDFATIPSDTLVLVPVNCSCSGNYYQYNSSYTVIVNDTYLIISNNTYQGLTTCQAMMAQNPYDPRALTVGNRLLVPLRCACPTSAQSAAGFKYLISYLVITGDFISTIAAKFTAEVQSVFDANELSSNVIYPSTPILVPLRAEPKINESQQTSPPPPPPPQTPTGVGESKSSKKWVFVGVAAAASSLILLGLFGFLFYFNKRRSRKPKPLLEPRPPLPTPQLRKFSDSSDFPPSISSQGIRHEIESLTLYKFGDIQAATGNFDETNRIKGSVYRASFKDDDAAVKVMKGDVSAEINLLKKINHTNIIRLSGFCFHEGSSYLVYQYAENGSISDWLQSNKNQASHTLSWQQRVRIAYDVADALNYLHNYTNPPYIHKNLKTSNILLDGNFRAKIANFGLARTLENGNDGGLQLTRHVVGTQGYLAPEYIENGVITPKLDVFAFGVVMLELLSGREAAAAAERNGEGELLSASIERVLEGDNVREKLEGFMDPALQHEYPLELAFSMAQLAKNCVAHDLNARPSTADALNTLSKILSSSYNWDPSDELDRSTSMSSSR